MKSFLTALVFSLCLPAFSFAQDSKYAADVESLDNILSALYGVISGEKGEARDWDRFRYLFAEGAKLIPIVKNQAGDLGLRMMSPGDYVERGNKVLVENGFFESEISRETEEYGALVHVFSTYESRHSAADPEPFARGINSIQLLNDGNRWWIVNIYWLGETKDWPLPKQYLPKGKKKRKK